MAVEHTSMTTPRPLSIRFTRKGALIPETYAAARSWNPQLGVDANLVRIRQENLIGAKSSAWLKDVVVTLAARFRQGGGLLPLVTLAQGGYPIERWRDGLLWHLGAQGALWYAFLTEWLFPAYTDGVIQMRANDVVPFVLAQTKGLAADGQGLTTYGQTRTARDLLLMADAFGLLQGRVVKAFAGYQLDDAGFLYVLHALAEREAHPQRIIEAPEWRMYLMRPADVEHVLLRLHQFQRVEYQAAGSIIHLRLPYRSLLAYAESLVS
ncbi:MAG: hypothetical protein WCI67_00535 [Chloroflexales bacterium]